MGWSKETDFAERALNDLQRVMGCGYLLSHSSTSEIQNYFVRMLIDVSWFVSLPNLCVEESGQKVMVSFNLGSLVVVLTSITAPQAYDRDADQQGRLLQIEIKRQDSPQLALSSLAHPVSLPQWLFRLPEEHRAHLIECQIEWLGSSPTWRTVLKMKFLTLGFLLGLLRGHFVYRLLKPLRPLRRPRL